MLRKLAFVIIETFLKGNAKHQIVASCLLLVIVWAVQIVANPYTNPNLDALDEVRGSQSIKLSRPVHLLTYSDTH